MKSYGILLVGLLLAQMAAAQQAVPEGGEAAAEPPEAIPHYTTEIIIFAYAEDVFTGTEIFLPEVVTPPVGEQDDDRSDDDAVAGTGTDAAVDGPAGGADDGELRYVYPFAYTILEEDELTLTDAWSELDTLDVYEPLMHFGWTQPTISEAQTPTLDIGRFGPVPPGLDGSLKLYRSRFLHLEVDVSLAAPESAMPGPGLDEPYYGEPVAVFGDERVQAADVGTVLDPRFAPLRYRLTERRIVKNGETRYYDHPKLGVIAKVVRIEQDEPGEDLPLPRLGVDELVQ